MNRSRLKNNNDAKFKTYGNTNWLGLEPQKYSTKFY
jgi:hypothetical protein